MEDTKNDGNEHKQILIYQPNIGLSSKDRHPVEFILNISLANEKEKR